MIGKNLSDTYKNPEWLRHHYIDLDMTLVEIAEIVGCAPSTIAEWLYQFSIPARNAGCRKGEKNHRWKGGPQERTCEVCGTAFYMAIGHIRQGRGRFCSSKCFGIAYAENIKKPIIIKNSVVEIPLSKGRAALVDEADTDLAERTWHCLKIGYAARTERSRQWGDNKKRHIYLHRLIVERMIGRPLRAKEGVDHANRNKLDNRRCNLRLSNQSLNGANRPKHIMKGRSASQYKGVRFEKGHWVAYLGRKRLGRCQDEITAARAYDKVARERYREFAYLNFPDEESQGQP